MSRDKTLKSAATLARHRNVLSRAERIERLKELGRWDDRMGPLGLPKVAHRKVAVGKKAKAKKGPEGEAKPGEGEKPAPGAKT
jgi:small basic protein (TIGR04137 family)